jgi:hypothetical protein
MEIAVYISLFLSISFWAYCNLFYERQALPYRSGYVIFAMVQWVTVAVNLIHYHGWLIGIIATVLIVAFGAVVVTNFTTNQIYRFIFGGSPQGALALFAIMVWVNIAMTIAAFFVS